MKQSPHWVWQSGVSIDTGMCTRSLTLSADTVINLVMMVMMTIAIMIMVMMGYNENDNNKTFFGCITIMIINDNENNTFFFGIMVMIMNPK